MGQDKIPWYSHRLLHRKRVTCELHDSYFRLMTIKHAIPKILSGWLNYYITRQRKPAPSRVGPQASGWAALERGKETLMAIRVGVNMLQSLFGLQLPLTHTTLSNKVRGIFFKEVFAHLYYGVKMYSACICVYMQIYYVSIQQTDQRVIFCQKNLHGTSSGKYTRSLNDNSMQTE